jgi:hypothetical protein
LLRTTGYKVTRSEKKNTETKAIKQMFYCKIEREKWVKDDWPTGGR